jgi:hypothetical protein
MYLAVYCGSAYGPTMSNLLCHNNNWSYTNYDNRNRYPKIGIPEKF